jgi:hypothetical protein
MARLNLQKLREEYSSLPQLTHHPDVICHGKRNTNPNGYIKRRFPTYDKKVEDKL